MQLNYIKSLSCTTEIVHFTPQNNLKVVFIVVTQNRDNSLRFTFLCSRYTSGCEKKQLTWIIKRLLSRSAVSKSHKLEHSTHMFQCIHGWNWIIFTRFHWSSELYSLMCWCFKWRSCMTARHCTILFSLYKPQPFLVNFYRLYCPCKWLFTFIV